jgi:pilus assembly protein CpaE
MGTHKQLPFPEISQVANLSGEQLMSNANDGVITILLVDDIAETRESIKKLLAFEQEFKVVGTASNGREGVERAKELEPDIVIMDINMPDMDGLEAAGLITKSVPAIGVIMMSVQDDPDYMQKAMLAGARFFLTKPVNMDQLYSTIRNVYQQYAPIRDQLKRLKGQLDVMPMMVGKSKKEGDRPGHIIAVYSPKGGTGCTTIATSLASGLMKEGIKTLLVDVDLEFGDVGVFLEMKSPTTLVDLVENADDVDIEYFDSVVSTHNSGVKVLLGPRHPSYGIEVRDNNPEAIASIINQIAGHYDFVILDLGKSIDAVSAPLLEMATKIVLITVPTLPCIKNVKLVLDFFDQAGFGPEKTMLVINKAIDSPSGRVSKVYVPAQRIQSFLKRPVEGLIPLVDEAIILTAIQSGVPVIASDRDTSKDPIKQLLELSNHVFSSLMGTDSFFEEDDILEEKPKRSGIRGLFGGGR